MGDEREHRSTVSMPEARRVDTNPPVRVRAEEIPTHRRLWPSGALRCADCEAEVQAVYPTSKERSRAQRPYFRRKGTADKQNQHARDCFYNVAERIRVIRDSSGEALVRDRPNGDRPRYRLVVPEAFGPADQRASEGGGRHVVAEKFTTVLNTAAKIAALLEDYAARGADPNIEWIAECRGVRVEWLNFLYIPQRIWVLRNRLPEDGGELTHPVAVIFRAQEKKTKFGRPFLFGIPFLGYRAATYPLPPEPGRPKLDRLFVVGDRELMDVAFADGLGKYYIGYGMWKRRGSHQPGISPVGLQMDNAAQIAHVPSDIGGVARTRWGTRPATT